MMPNILILRICFPGRRRKADKSTDKYELWEFSDTKPSKSVIKHLNAESVYIATKLMMDNHMYKFSNDIRVQDNSGSIGVEFTGVAAEIHMLKWCQKFCQKMQELGIKNSLHARLVDDITLMPKIIEPGVRLENDKLVYHSENESEDKLIPDDERTMKIISQIADSIDMNTRVTFDIPSKN